jgi:hypothetical protein
MSSTNVSKCDPDKAIHEGDHIFSSEINPTGKAEIAKGKGVPASVTLLVDGAPLGEGVRESTHLSRH